VPDTDAKVIWNNKTENAKFEYCLSVENFTRIPKSSIWDGELSWGKGNEQVKMKYEMGVRF
jgi:hypothetical protein